MSQLTLTLDDDLLAAAHAYARQHGQQLNTLVAELLRAAVRPAPTPTQAPAPLMPLVHELYGSLAAPDLPADYKAAWGEAIEEKYGS